MQEATGEHAATPRKVFETKLDTGGEVIRLAVHPGRACRRPSYSRQKAHSVSRRSNIAYRVCDKTQIDDAIASKSRSSSYEHLHSRKALHGEVCKTRRGRHRVRRSENMGHDEARYVL